MVTNPATPGSDAARTAVLPRSVSPSGKGMNGLGAASRDRGHSRVPAPPDRMIGINAIDANSWIDDSESAILYPIAVRIFAYRSACRVKPLQGNLYAAVVSYLYQPGAFRGSSAGRVIGG